MGTVYKRLIRHALLLVAAVTLAVTASASPALAADTEPPSAPADLIATDLTETSLVLRWTASTDNVAVTEYTVTYFITDVGYQLSTSTNSITVTGLSRSRTYQFAVYARDAAANTSRSVGLRVTMPPGDSQPPSTPGTPVASAITDTSLTLRWAPSTDNVLLAAYDVYRVDTPAPTFVATVWQLPPAQPGNLGVQVPRLSPGTQYQFSVRARDEAGNLSPFSGILTVSTTGGSPLGCAVLYQINSQWPGGFQTLVTIRNTGSTVISTWSLGFSFPNGQTVGHAYMVGTWTQNGTNVTFTNAAWNGTIQPGGSVSFGFLGTWTGANAVPVGFTVNGSVC